MTSSKTDTIEKSKNPIIDPVKRKKDSAISFSIIGIFSLIIFGLVNYFSNNTFGAYFELGLAFLGIINLIVLIKTNYVELCGSLLLLLMTSVLAYLFVDGGIANTGPFWFFTFPALAFFMKGKKGGLFWSIFLALFTGSLLLSGAYGLFDVAIKSDVARQLLASYVAVTSIIFFYQDTNEKAEKLIVKQNEEVAIAVENLSNEIFIRKTSEEKMQKLLDDFESKNDLLEKTKLAVINLLQDVQDEKQVSLAEKDKLNTILQSIGDGVFVVDTDLNIVLINHTALKLVGKEKEVVIGQKYTDILDFRYEDTGELNNRFVVDAIKTGLVQSMSNHTVLMKGTDEKIAVSDSAAPLLDKDNKVTGVVIVFRDVSKEREIDKAKTEFVSLASHQLRTPLSAINWYSEMLLSGDSGKLSPEQADFVEEIYAGNKRMVELVNSLLNTSRIDLGTFTIDPKPTDIVQISESVVKELQSQIDEKKLKFETKYDEIGKIPLDTQLTRIIIQNLLSNAVKYTPDEGEVSISIEKTEPNLVITVKDNGYGITESQKNKIFQKLFRADNVKVKNTEGTGLGLYIVKAILDASGGQITFTSKENKGSTFIVTIPLTGMVSKEGTKSLG